MEVDLGARPLGEPRERLDAPQPDRDVERIRELRPNPSGGAARGSARELIALEEADVRARLREVERDARPDDASTDDDDVGGCGERAHRRTRFLTKKPRFAGRSASLRMRYGYHRGRTGRDEHLVPLRCDPALQPWAHAVQHLELEPVAGDSFARRERLDMPDDRLVVRRDGDVRTSSKAALDELDVSAIDIRLVRIRDRRRLEVGALDDAQVRVPRQ